MAGVMNVDRSRTRRDRTFVGSECAVCEEPLEHTLRGERVLQFSCTHVAHEACVYEYIKEFEGQYCPTCDAPLELDTSRGGHVLDIEKLSNIVRSATSDAATQRSLTTPTPWDQPPSRGRPPSDTGSRSYHHDSRDHWSRRDSRDTGSQRDRMERLTTGSRQQHSRNGSAAGSSGDYEAQHQSNGRRHDYDVQAMESDLSPRPPPTKNPIPAPTVTIRSEFPTLNRSRQQQSLTCLITVEIPEGSWGPDSEDFRKSTSSALPPQDEPYGGVMRFPTVQEARSIQSEPQENLDDIAEDLRTRVDNWHGLEFARFGKLRLHGHMRVGKDRESWQELECYLFAEMLICIKEKKVNAHQYDDQPKRKSTRSSLKGSILIRKHLKSVEISSDEPVLTLNLSVSELPCFFLRFQSRNQLETWRRALRDLHQSDATSRHTDYDVDHSGAEEEDYRVSQIKRQASINSSYGAGRSNNTAITDYTAVDNLSISTIHIPLDVVVVIPVSSSMQGLKITLLRDALKFLVQNLGPRDRMGLVTFGSSGGGVPLVGMTTKSWGGWNKILNSIRPVGQKSLRADVVEGANVAMDLLMQRKSNNPVSTILLISDSSTSDPESVDFVVSRAEAAKISIHSFGLGLTHKPDTMIELSTRTKGSYLYVKDWMMLRECVAGCLGALQTTSHQNVKLKLRLPEGSPAKFVKISGALHTTKRATGRDAEAALGDLRFGDKRDVLVQLVIQPDNSTQESMPQDPWESLVSGLEALGGGSDGDEQRVASVEEVPLIQADLTYGDLLRDGHLTHSPRPSLLAITMLPLNPRARGGRPSTPPIPPHPSIVQRRMELLTSDMLTRALTLVTRGQHDRAQHLLTETRSILKGLGKGGLPPLPPGAAKPSGHIDAGSRGETPLSVSPQSSNYTEGHSSAASDAATIAPVPAVDAQTMTALDADLESALEWINHPAVFGRDSRKAVLQAIGVISSQRAYTYRTPSEAHWAQRVLGIRRLTERSKDWRETGDDALTEE
ncbi:VWA and PH domain-containing RING finger protein [Aspergillus clavatus NRRL 1]|uniref:von Willebrand and RING finger domain protein n=1 Tax=Aspergillus clavatus (strain ATCC 1007 / CBS 513.65 / DSM 816 / NCTC 3887 / NRRL 1 / QM 1276 / 107) TaxID=344612 RepID=A1CE88_ASPCL|nr:von Willebrand and RING finger domain protein [Aspergillus clavatus NRRL 1]EAW11187.1 von Willebrand and RING finger domain protein [Aspergillus clavatus NRRL 1]